ncbi:MAG: ComEA family DNA-binding protein [Actinomycetes bacterium]
MSTTRSRLRAVADVLAATPTEVAGLVGCLLCAALGTAVLVWLARPVPTVAEGAGDPAGWFSSAADATGAGLEGQRGDGAAPGGGEGGTVVAADVTVHVAGAVVRAGLVTLPAGSRVGDAVEAAGGAVAGADLSAVNLARALVDGEQVVVPLVGQAPAGDPAGAGAGAGDAAAGPGVDGGGARGPDGLLDVNRATAAELEQLPGIGPVLAQRIVDSRTSDGPFTAVGDLRRVSGIGERTLAGFADLVTVR